MKVTVLRGGPSSEREISLVSGKAVADALRAAGHTVFESDVSPTDLSFLDTPCDVVFPVLHGQFGESGELQLILERRGVPFVGSGSEASHTGMDKAATKRRLESCNIATPGWKLIDLDDPAALDLAARVGVPCVVKSLRGGSSIDVFLCKRDEDVAAACQKLSVDMGEVLVEQMVVGTEITVGILEERALPAIRIDTGGGWFDFNSKYAAGGARHCLDTGLADQVVEQATDMALRTHRAVGCRDLSRVDIIVDQADKPWVLEINTMPGFTPRSLLPEAAGKVGYDFPKLCDLLARRAFARGADLPRQAVA
ncbi:MAG: D-alanine--D-alanine ligase [Phycisphaerae bacterium]